MWKFSTRIQIFEHGDQYSKLISKFGKSCFRSILKDKFFFLQFLTFWPISSRKTKKFSEIKNLNICNSKLCFLTMLDHAGRQLNVTRKQLHLTFPKTTIKIVKNNIKSCLSIKLKHNKNDPWQPVRSLNLTTDQNAKKRKRSGRKLLSCMISFLLHFKIWLENK